MPNFAAKISSAYLSDDAQREFLAQLPSVWHEIFGVCMLKVSYGCGSGLHHDLWYKHMRVPLDVFPYFIEESIEQEIFTIGGSDLHIESPDSGVRILMCHESDIHIDGSDDQSIHGLIARFPALDFRTSDEWQTQYEQGSADSGGVAGSVNENE